MTTQVIWKSFHKELFRFIRKRVNDDDIAHDILQDVFIRIHLKKNELSSQNKLKAWVYQICRNRIADHFRKLGKTKEWMDIPEEEPGEKNDLSNCIRPFVNQLAPKYKDALLKTELGKWSQKEYAEKRNLSYSGAKSRIQRARKELHHLFLDCCEFIKDSRGNAILAEDEECSQAC